MASLWQFVPILVAAAGMLALAGWLLWLDWGRTSNRVFAAVLILRASTFIAGAWRGVAPVGQQAFINSLAPYLVIPLVPLTLYLVSVHPRRRGILATRPWAPWLLMAASLAMLLWYLLDPAAYGTTVDDPEGLYVVNAGPDRAYASFGPLILFTALRLPVFAFAGLVFARDYVRTPPGATRHSALLLYAGFGLNAYFDGTNAAFSFARFLQTDGIFPWAPWGWAFAILPTASLLLAIASTLVIVQAQWKGTIHSRFGVRRSLIGAAVATASAVIVSESSHLGLPAADEFLTLVLGTWRLVLPGLVTYALLRYSLFDMDLKVKRGLRKGTVVASFVVLLILLSEVLESLVAQAQGQVFGLATAGLMTVTFRPVEQFGLRVADRMLPEVKPIEDQSHEERARFYADHVLLAKEDGRLTAKERHLLDVLGDQLGITPKQAAAIEARVGP